MTNISIYATTDFFSLSFSEVDSDLLLNKTSEFSPIPLMTKCIAIQSNVNEYPEIE